MKRINVFSATLLMVILFASVAYAGIGETIKDFLVDQAAAAIIAGVFTVLSLFFGAKVLKFRSLIINLVEAFNKYSRAREIDSAGGDKVTPEEWTDIFESLRGAVKALIELLPDKLKAKLPNI